MTIKMRRVGTSDVLTVPKSIKNRSSEYEVYQDRNGAIVYMPKRKNPFKDSKFVENHLYDGDDTRFVNGGVKEDELPQ
ncbi:antitoxin of toxin-antitoxin stability system [Limosilactobacillus sp. Sa3CUN2]|uniref:Antitoxin of toxin-antitoxin stability system n=1 Tax=Limosilactobacillus avistercoris TaxID=2762243 RepID=A0ABR8PD64_9LACO|nr:antitoxin of toxin-antitoxin stability system [Limosilactobacillus avistercoris]MBD7895226.1 antitoxin of toxin-antitoxin stability system [Limosilactobacillus avistercoris]